MKKWCALLLSMIVLLAACGNKYDEEFDKIIKQERESRKESKFKKPTRENSNFKVYEEGKVILLSYVYDDENTIHYSLYKKNETSGDYEEEDHVNEEEYEKNNKPDYEENNMSK